MTDSNNETKSTTAPTGAVRVSHRVRVCRVGEGDYVARCACGWRHGPDTQFRAAEEAVRHARAHAR